MRVFSAAFCAAGMLLPLASSAAVHPHRHSSAHTMVRHSSGVAHAGHAEHTSSEHFTSSMSSERATQIQTALIKQGYLSGEPSGTWDATSIAAMQKLQGDNNWQTKLIPDSRALIKLGLGPGSTPTALPAVVPANPSIAGVQASSY